jgi:hypothetical protein
MCFLAIVSFVFHVGFFFHRTRRASDEPTRARPQRKHHGSAVGERVNQSIARPTTTTRFGNQYVKDDAGSTMMIVEDKGKKGGLVFPLFS